MKEKTVTVTAYELDELRELIVQRSGILFDASRERFFSTRVREYVTEKNLQSGTDLLRAVHGSNVEYDAMLERMLTQETSFFRYPAVFDALAKKILPELQEKKFWDNPRTLRIWSAACSTGEEPYSIAMWLLENWPGVDSHDIEIIGSDIDTEALAAARMGIFGKRSLMRLTPDLIEKYFNVLDGERWQILGELRDWSSFRPRMSSSGTKHAPTVCLTSFFVEMY